MEPPTPSIPYINPEMVRMKYKNTIYKGKKVSVATFTFRHPLPQAPFAPLEKAPEIHVSVDQALPLEGHSDSNVD